MCLDFQTGQCRFLAAANPTSWICERQLSEKPTFRFLLEISGVDQNRLLNLIDEAYGQVQGQFHRSEAL
jgi:hypothetical protein